MAKPKAHNAPPKPKIGRPFRAGGPTTYVLTIRLTDPERDAFARAAGEQPISEWARAVLTRAAARSAK